MSIAGSGLTNSEGRVTMLRLPPFNEINKYIEYFYEGSVTVTRGVALVPSHKVEWIERLLNMGYILLDAADASTPEIAAANQATMEANDGYGFLDSLGYTEDEPLVIAEGTSDSEPVDLQPDTSDEVVLDADL